MKSMKLFESINDIDEKIIKEAESKQFSQKNNCLYLWKKILPVAACIAIVIIIFLYKANPNVGPISPHSDTDLPMLSIDIDNFFSGGYGFEGYMSYDVSDLKNENPWNEDVQISTLPVFKNTSSYGVSGTAPNPNIKVMQDKAKEVASLLGIDLEDIEITDNFPSEEMIEKITEKFAATGEEVPNESFIVDRVYIKSENIEIEVVSNLVTTIRFKPAITLPQEYNFTHFATYDDIHKVALYLHEEYKELLQMASPTINVNGGDYNIYAEQQFGISFFDSNGSLEEQIINYNFNYVTFACDEEGKLFISRIYQPDLSEKIGEYPIITPEQAEQLLTENEYITTVPESFPGVDYVKKVELVYRNGREEIFIPYYRFYVEMPSMKRDNGLNTYGAYYVPAIEEQYIENMPLWDGSFN